jgi:hypothetical protein
MAADYPEILAAAAYSEALNRHTPLLTAFERGLRIVDELFQRLEREMYSGPGYEGGYVADHQQGPKKAGRPPTKGFLDPKLANTAVALSRALSQAGAVHARLLQDENARADRMSDAEKIDFMLAAMRTKPLSVRQAFCNELLK